MWSLLEFFPDPDWITVLDVGAAPSEVPSYQGLLEAGRVRLIGFEPDELAHQLLAATYGDPHQFFPYFVGDGQPATFYETNWTLTGSLFEPNTELLRHFQQLAELVTPVATHTVETVRLDDIEAIDTVDFIKIDVQGSELRVFQHAQRILSQTLVIQTEVEFLELYKEQPLFADVDAFLRSQGFQFLMFWGFGARALKPLLMNNNPGQGNQMLWSDAVYLRDWRHLDILSDLQLQRYAILAHDVLRAYDFAHYILEALDSRVGTTLAPNYLNRLTSLPTPQ